MSSDDTEPDVGFATTNPGEGALDLIVAQVALPERYEDLGSIATGGMGEVRRVRDRKLGRTLAMKIVSMTMGSSLEGRHRFEVEARITSRLQHPGIVTVHDFGELDDGRLWYTMREVRGVTLAHLITDVHRAVSSGRWNTRTPSGWSIRRLIGVFDSMCQAMAFAHDAGVIHRDLKPSNVMVGAFGEVQVMDWGIAKSIGHRDGGRMPRSPIAPETMAGSVMGTIAYMAPEQARGEVEAHGPWTDVYSLGAVLYHILVGQTHVRGTTREVVRRIAREPLPKLADTLAEQSPELPAELVEMCDRAMAFAPSDRYPSAAALALDVQAWLDGSARRERARRTLASVDQHRAAAREGAARAVSLRNESEDALSGVAPHDPVTLKLPAWRIEEEAERVDSAAALDDARYLQGLHAALALAPDLPEVHERLADHYRRQFEQAERSGDTAAAVRYDLLLRSHDRGRHAEFLAGEGQLVLQSDPPGATVVACRFITRDRRLQSGPVRRLGVTPLDKVRLQRGSYLLTLARDGFAPVTAPVKISRGETWHGEEVIKLPARGELAADECYVPGGPFMSGGDPEAADGLSARTLRTRGFVMKRHPVTNAQYVAFLDALVASGQEEQALAHQPFQLAGVSSEPRPVFARDATGRFVLDELAWGARLAADQPVVLVNWHGACAYADWMAKETGQPWRLPHSQEWEKAARGVDGRRLPWGRHLDPTWACIVTSHEDAPECPTVYEYEGDESVYGVRGLVGTTRDWCLDAYSRAGLPDGSLVEPVRPAEDEPYRIVRGGAWSASEAFSLPAGRFALAPDTRMTGVGFRLVRSWPG